MGSWRVYIVRCADDTLYTGVTNRLRARMKAHNAARGAKYTRSRRPVVLVWSARCRSRGEALSLERAIKQLTRRQKEALISVEGSSRRQIAAKLQMIVAGDAHL
jgi:putative endonuclease